MLAIGGGIIGIIALILAIWVIVDVLTKQKRMRNGEKAVWIILAVFFSIITAIVYYFMRKK